MRRAIILAGVVVTLVRQSSGSPIIDKCAGRTREGKRWHGYAIHLAPWRKDRYGTRLSATALCIGRVF